MLSAALLVVGLVPAVAQAAEQPQPVIRPQNDGDTAVHSAQRIEISGTAPAGTITRGFLLGLARDGRVLRRSDVGSTLNQPGVVRVTANDFVRNDAGRLTGQLQLGSAFAEPDPENCGADCIDRVALDLTIAGATGRSNLVRFDPIRPTMRGYEVINGTRIRVIFSEPVRQEDGDLATDWTVQNPTRRVVAVENPPQADCREPKSYPEAEHECTRILVLDQPLAEDDEPTVDYTNSDNRVPDRGPYEDFASWPGRFVGLARLIADDLVRPAKPNIESIDGKVPSGGEAHSNNASPTVRVTNLTSGHTLTLNVTRPDGSTSPLTETVPSGANTVDINVPTLPADGGYTMSAVATDINGNRSDEDAKNPPRNDGARPTAQYLLDTLAPQAIGARLVNTRSVDVQFSEPIYPPGNAGQWFIGDQRVAAEGSEAQRRLVSPVDLPAAPGAVRWVPGSGGPGTTDRYGDRAGNGLAAINGLPLTNLPAVSLPTVEQPSAETYTNASRQTIAGSAPDQANLVVDLFDRGAQAPRRSTQVENGRWSFAQELEADRRYQFEVRLRNTQTGVTSERVAVPDIVKDTTKPIVDVTEPGPAPLTAETVADQRQRYGVGDTVAVKWRATDTAANDPEVGDHGDTVDIIAVYGDGTRRVAASGIKHQPATDLTYNYRLTSLDLAGQGRRQITFEVVVADLASNRGSDASAPILLLAELIGYTPVMTRTDTIEARFPVQLTGETAPGEWFIDGVPAQTATKTTRDSATVIVLTMAQNSNPNATPAVEYRPLAANPAPLRTSNGTEVSRTRRFAVDLVRPAKPNLDSVAGRAPADGQVAGRERNPQVRVSNVRAGDFVVVTATGPGGPYRDTVQVPTGANAVAVDLRLGPDAEYDISVVAIDPSGNRSDESGKNGPGNDGARQSVRYLLDTVAPQVLAATLATSRSVRVSFSEAIFPAGNAGRWFVGELPATAQGSGNERTLATSSDIGNGDDLSVRWEPTSDQPGSAGRYGDRAGNGLAAITGIPLDALPAVPAPGITQPTAEQYTRANSVKVAGTAPTSGNLVAELFERGAEQPRSTTQVRNGAWSFDVPLDADRRYEFEVRLRNTDSGVASQRVAVADVVRDTQPPVVDVTSPAPAPLTPTNPTERREQYGIGDAVSVRWTATDSANDPERPDHGNFADVIVVYQDGTRRTVAQGIEHQAGRQQTYTYTLTAADLAGRPSQELRFEVAVTDLATNRGSDQSAPILLLANLIGYAPVLTQPGVIEARFPVLLVGETLPTEWMVDGVPAQQATKTTRDGVTIVRLTAQQSADPNATPVVQYRKSTVNPVPLRTAEGIEVSPAPRDARDGIVPALKVDAPDHNGAIVDADSVTFSGTTDETESPNTVSAFRADANGAPQGSAIARTAAGEDGAWSLDVPLEANALNRIVVRAVDPSGNVSEHLPNPPFTVTEDSLDPVVQMISPAGDSLVGDAVNIRWVTTEANPGTVDIDYRAAGGQWREVKYNVEDDGSHDWELPQSVREEVFAIRVTATDKAGKTGSATVSGLRRDFELPTIVKARATGAQVVEITFSEPVAVDGAGFEADGATVRSVKGEGSAYTFVLRRSIKTATPTIAYSGTSVRDAAGNQLAATDVIAKRSFAFAVKSLQGQRLSPKRVRIAWSDTRNRGEDLRGYRVFRDGERIAQLGPDARAFVDRNSKRRHTYTVRAVDDRRRLSSVRRTTISG